MVNILVVHVLLDVPGTYILYEWHIVHIEAAT